METIQFGEDTLYATKTAAGEVMVALTPICDALGIASNGQRFKVQSDPRFNPYDSVWVAADGKRREMLCIPVKELHGWLFTINANRVKEASREKLLHYQRECMDVLTKHFGTAEADIHKVIGAVSQAQTAQAVVLVRHDTEIKDTNARINELERQLKPFHVGLASAAGKALASVKNLKN